MSKSKSGPVAVDCPRCPATLTTRVPSGADEAEFRLRGTETRCGDCGHVLSLYYY